MLPVPDYMAFAPPSAKATAGKRLNAIHKVSRMLSSRFFIVDPLFRCSRFPDSEENAGSEGGLCGALLRTREYSLVMQFL